MGVSAMTSPVEGLWTFVVVLVLGVLHSPPIKLGHGWSDVVVLISISYLEWPRPKPP
jgi:hypothetical protein